MNPLNKNIRLGIKLIINLEKKVSDSVGCWQVKRSIAEGLVVKVRVYLGLEAL